MTAARNAIVAAAALACVAFAGSVLAAEPAIKGLRLGMSLPEGEIDAVYEGPLAAEVEDSVGLTIPYDHIETKLTDSSRLSLHFSAPSDGTRLFWIRHAVSWRWPVARTSPDFVALMAGLEARFGPATRRVGPLDGSGSLLLVFTTPGSSADLPESLDIPPADIGGVQFLSFQQRVALFGADFSGAVVTVIVNENGVAAVVEELVDHRRGTTVLNPGS